MSREVWSAPTRVAEKEGFGALLLGLFAIGRRRALHAGRGATWDPSSSPPQPSAWPRLGWYPPIPPSITRPDSQKDSPPAGGVHQAAALALFAGLSGAAFVLA